MRTAPGRSPFHHRLGLGRAVIGRRFGGAVVDSSQLTSLQRAPIPAGRRVVEHQGDNCFNKHTGGSAAPAYPAHSIPFVTVVGMADDPSPPPVRNPSIGVHRFSDRLAGRLANDGLRADVSDQLARALREWLGRFSSTIGQKFVARATARLDISPDVERSGLELLDLVDEVLDLAITELRPIAPANEAIANKISELKTILDDHRSLYTLGDVNRQSGTGLVTRVDPSVQEAVSHVIGPETGSADQHLAAAWRALHQLHPDTATSYSEAVRAIEAALGPIVQPNANGPTLGQIKATLANSNTWASVLDRTGPQGKPPTIKEANQSSVVFLIDLLERVYGTHARHGRGDERREQTYAEAAAAVYAAVAVLGWAHTGLLVRVQPK